MKDSSVTTWITWVRDESNELIAAIDEEVTKRQDPDDPFDGTASGIFLPLQHENEVPPRQQEVQQVDESDNRNSQKGEPLEGRLVDIQSPGLQPNHHRKAETSEGGAAFQSEVQQGSRDIDVVDYVDKSARRPVKTEKKGNHITASYLHKQRRSDESKSRTHPPSFGNNRRKIRLEH